MQFQSVKETAKRFNISERRVQKLCEEGRIEGAQKIGNVWVIPDTSSKPADERFSACFSAKTDNMISLTDLCRELSISAATGRNWVKLGKIVPATTYKNTPFFAHDYAAKLKRDIQSGSNGALKSRRNKKYVSGNRIYRSYVSDESVNAPAIQFVVDRIEENNIKITEDVLLALLVDCAVQLILSRTGKLETQDGIFSFLNGKYKKNPYMFLAEDLMLRNPFIAATVENYSDLFTARYVYEEGEDILGLLYISLKNIGSRKATGSYYTPTRVVKKLCRNLLSMNEIAGKTVIDPCCGTGNFILQLPDAFAFHHVYGNDIDAVSVRIARINYALKYQIHDKDILYKHITEQDYLTCSAEQKYDFIIGNPPWGYHYSEAEKSELRRNFSCAAGLNIESYDLFVEQALRSLKPNGVLSFVLPEAFLNVKTHTSVRQLLLRENSIQYIEYLGNAFDEVHCPCILLQVLHTGTPFSSAGLTVNDGERIFTIHSSRAVHADFFSFGMTDEEYSVIEKIENVNSKATLAGQAIFALGIVTGNNKEFISTEKRENNEMVLKGSDVYKYRFRDAENYIVFKPELFQQTAPMESYRADEKLLYRFICSQLVFAYDNRKTLSLNSCNILIPQIPGTGIKYVLAILNSRIAQFYFKKQFHSVKVLRSHLERIPIPVTGKEIQEQMIHQVDSILAASDRNTVVERYDALDIEIANLFNLCSKEYDLIKRSMDGDNLFLY